MAPIGKLYMFSPHWRKALVRKRSLYNVIMSLNTLYFIHGGQWIVMGRWRIMMMKTIMVWSTSYLYQSWFPPPKGPCIIQSVTTSHISVDWCVKYLGQLWLLLCQWGWNEEWFVDKWEVFYSSMKYNFFTSMKCNLCGKCKIWLVDKYGNGFIEFKKKKTWSRIFGKSSSPLRRQGPICTMTMVMMIKIMIMILMIISIMIMILMIMIMILMIIILMIMIMIFHGNEFDHYGDHDHGNDYDHDGDHDHDDIDANFLPHSPPRPLLCWSRGQNSSSVAMSTLQLPAIKNIKSIMIIMNRQEIFMWRGGDGEVSSSSKSS